MQLQFEKQGIRYLQTVKREIQNGEQTQELRISDGMPDIGSIIGAWGQVILRSKEWQGDGMSVSGGTMVWVQYMPEEGGQPQYVESWLPFQMRWSFPQTQYDGTILTQAILRSEDARSLSARKMMLRTNVSVLGWALEKQEQELFSPVDIPEDVQLRTERYPMLLPAEAGEKAFTLEETLTLPPSVPRIENIISYSLTPELTEEKMMGDKVVFRGNAVLHILYCADDGGQYTWDYDLPFTQYSELDGEYEESTELLFWPCVTSLEMDREEDRLNVKAGLVCQYRISRRLPVEVVEDAYSTGRSVIPASQALELPAILESKTQTIHAQQNSSLDGMRLTDVQFIPKPVRMQHSGNEAVMELSGQFQLLYYDMDGNLRIGTQKWEENVTMPIGEGAALEATLWPCGKTQGSFMSGSAQMSADMKLITEAVNGNTIPMITGLELGELQQPDPHRPSLILRRAGGQNLWELAKRNGSTVEAIQRANNLQDEPEASQMLLIPVM